MNKFLVVAALLSLSSLTAAAVPTPVSAAKIKLKEQLLLSYADREALEGLKYDGSNSYISWGNQSAAIEIALTGIFGKLSELNINNSGSNIYTSLLSYKQYTVEFKSEISGEVRAVNCYVSFDHGVLDIGDCKSGLDEIVFENLLKDSKNFGNGQPISGFVGLSQEKIKQNFGL